MSTLSTTWEPQTRKPTGQGPRLLHQFFDVQVELRPHHTAIEFADETLTYAELDQYSNQIANALAARGVRPGDLVALYLKKSPRLYGAMLGILKAGAGYVPIDPRFPLERISAILEDSRARVIVTEAPLADELTDAITTPRLRLDLDAHKIARLPNLLPWQTRQIQPSSLCYVIYTSGSTGRPKGVMIEHRNAAAFVRSLKTVYKVDAEDRIYQGFSTAFDASVEEIWAAFSRGAALIVPTEDVERSPADVAAFINEKEITYYSTVPTMLSMIDRELPTVRTLVLGGEACSSELVTRWATPGRRMLNTYGPTEATVVATWSECVPGEAVTIGRALPEYSTFVLDEQLHPVAHGESGELFIGGPALARGYMNSEALTNERFIPNPFETNGSRLYRTHDHVRLGDNGDLFFLGRLDGQIKIRGFRVELSEIEAVLTEHPSIQAAAVGVFDNNGMQELAAYVVCDGGEETLDRADVTELLRRRMPGYMVPQYLDVVASLPMMPSGKIDRKSLPAPQKPISLAGAVVAPANETERQIAAAWQEIFRLPEISVEADFFVDLNGHSLLAARTVTLMRRLTGSMKISVRDVYEHRTIRSLAAHVGETQPARPVATDAISAWAQTLSASNDVGTPSDIAFRNVHPLMRWTTVGLQAIAVTLFYGLLAAPFAYVSLMVISVIDGRIDWVTAAQISTAVGFAAWPVMLLFSIAVKWLVVGRYKPGRYPVWGFYYLRWWIANRFQTLAWADMFTGTPLMTLYWRAMGAKIGRNVTICTQISSAYDVISIGDNTCVGLETQILGYRVEDGYLIIAPATIGKDCFIGMHCAVGLGTSMGDGARLDDMSLLADGTAMQAGEMRRGVPALPAEVEIPEAARSAKANGAATTIKRAFFGLAHLILIYMMGYFLIATILPSTVLVLGALYLGGPALGIFAAFLAVPVGLLAYIRGAIMLKRLIGPLKTGTSSIYSVTYLRHWFASFLLENTKTILGPLYATVFLPGVMREFGAKIGRGVEISTASHICPDVLEVGDGSFLADACLVGGQRVGNGKVEYGAVKIGSKTFIGNSALVSGGHSIGNDVLIGVASTPPANTAEVPSDTRWLGAPGFSLPNTQQVTCFADKQIFKPSIFARLERALTDFVRILLPGLIAVADGIAFVTFLVIAFRTLPLWGVIAAIPVVAATLAFVSIMVTALLKALLTGSHGAVVKPLWSRFVWHNELVNGVYESVAAAAMMPLMGTPFVAACLRMMGCKIGKWCFIETTLFSEFDLVEVGDRACLNLGATIQTHLFEDRIFKADSLKIGEGCTVGNMAVVLYSTEMQPGSVLGPLSVLMKGEVLPPLTHWHGIPCERIEGSGAFSKFGTPAKATAASSRTLIPAA
jgi:non-ribosomal peptide synthetase-like protein